MANKYLIGILVLVVLSASIYVLLPENVRIDVGKTYSTFKVWENDSWVLAGKEYTLMFDGTKKMRASSRSVEHFVEEEIIEIVRTANFKNNVTVIDTYTFDGNVTDIKLFPISHDINVLNGEGYILVYEVTKLDYSGETIRDILSPQEFGHNMRIEWEEGNYYSRIWGYANRDEGKLTVKYRPDSVDFTKQVRLFDPAWWNSTWSKCKDITITNGGSSTLTDFPVYINVSKDDDMQADYNDLRFVDASCNDGGSELNYEIENYTGTKADIWVKTNLSAGDNVISVYYGNSEASSGENPVDVWDDNYKMVQHMKDDPDANYIADSTSYDNDGEKVGTNDPVETAGKIGNAQYYDGNDPEGVKVKGIKVSDSLSLPLDGVNNWTVEVWVYYEGTNAYYGSFNKGHHNDGPGFTAHGLNGRIQGGDGVANGYDTSNMFAEDLRGTGWRILQVTYDGSVFQAYLDGAPKNSLGWTYGIGDTSDFPIKIGAWWGPAYQGFIDEVRISNIVRSADWINQTYQVVANQGTYVVFGSEQEEEPEDTCTCPGAGNNWEVDMEDNCNLTEACNIGTGNLSWIGSSGFFNCSAQLNLTNRDAPPSGTTFYFSDGCEVIRL